MHAYLCVCAGCVQILVLHSVYSRVAALLLCKTLAKVLVKWKISSENAAQKSIDIEI